MANTVPTITPNCFQTAGPVQIWTNTGTSNAFEYLGDTRHGARISEQAFFDPLKSDISGGDRGPAADYQFLGEQHTIDLELARYSETVLAKLEERVNTGVSRTKGMLVGCAGRHFQVVLISVNFARKYTRVFLTEPIDRSSIGSTVMYPRVVFTALEDTTNTKTGNNAPVDGSPWNASITVTGGSLS